MKIITIAAQKGGSGKSTLAAHLSVQAQLAGGSTVALIDADPQGSLAAWRQERDDGAPIFAQALMARLEELLAELRDAGTEYAFIDTPPAITSTIGHAMKFADLVLIPTRPSPHDLRAAGITVDIAEGLQKPLIFVINGAHPRARITTQAALALSQHGPVAPVVIHQRTDFAASMIDGRTVMELPRRSRSPGEIAQLWDYVKERINSSARPGQSFAGSAQRVNLGELQRIA